MTTQSRIELTEATRYRTSRRVLVGFLVSVSLCSCQSVAPTLQRAERISKSGPPAITNAPVQGGHITDADAPNAVTNASLPSPALSTPISKPGRRASQDVRQVSHSGPMISAAPLEQYPQSSLGPSACSCGRAPQGLCECAQGTLEQRVFAPDEYLCNGGDRDTQVLVKGDWSVHGLHSGDTVAHFDTINGDLQVVHSNELCIYAPRFAAVRRVSAVIQHEQHERGAGVELAGGAISHHEHQIATTVNQPLQPRRHLSIGTAQRLRESEPLAGLESQQFAVGTTGDLLPFEEFSIVRHGQFDDSQKARLATRLQAAVTWSSDIGPQVVIDNRTAVEATGDETPQSVHVFDLPPGKPRLRIVKLASDQQAQPGDVIDFTLRFDNIGDQTVGNVTVIDRLVTRLEFVTESQSSSVDADFFIQESDGDSMVLRWELKRSLEVGEGGIIRFQARVR